MSAAEPLGALDPALPPLCETMLRAARVPGAAVAVVAGDTGYLHTFGVTSLRNGTPVTAATAFNVGSCSKAFVSATVASLVADGLVAWDDPIARWVPELELHDPAITRLVTLRDLSANRLGLPRVGLTEFGFAPEIGPERVLRGMRHSPPLFPFRDRFTYINAGHIANAVAVGRITGLGFLPTLRERILAPLGMSGTSGGAAAHALRELAGWHCSDGGEVVAIDPVFTDLYLGAGGMVVTGVDALAWLRFQLAEGQSHGRQVVARAALAETHRPHALGRPGEEYVGLFYPGATLGAYALGWAVSDLEGHPLVCHSGNDLGCSAMTLLLPRSRIGVAVYANVAGHAPVALAYAVAAHLLGLTPRDWAAYVAAAAARIVPPPARVGSSGPPGSLAAHEGVYHHPADGPLVIERAGDALTGCLRDGYRWEFTLEPAGGHRFAVRFAHPEWRAGLPTALEFTMSGGGASAVALLRWQVPRVFRREEAP